jgi:copper chaperone
MKTTTVTAAGITCGGCANAVKRAVSALPGVADVAVEISEKRVTVTHDDRVSLSAVEDALKKAGFQPA